MQRPTIRDARAGKQHGQARIDLLQCGLKAGTFAQTTAEPATPADQRAIL
jgi:hypothetical protein